MIHFPQKGGTPAAVVIRWTVEHASVYVPIQYDLRTDPWRVIVACALLRRATGHVVKSALERFFAQWPTPHAFYNARLEDVVMLLRPAGFQNQRYKTLASVVDLYLLYVEHHGHAPVWHDVMMWRELGPFTVQSYMIFVDRVDPRSLDWTPADHVLDAWLRSPLWPHFQQHNEIETYQPTEERT
jgi:adenine-specific DNA glycosylase